MRLQSIYMTRLKSAIHDSSLNLLNLLALCLPSFGRVVLSLVEWHDPIPFLRLARRQSTKHLKSFQEHAKTSKLSFVAQFGVESRKERRTHDRRRGAAGSLRLAVGRLNKCNTSSWSLVHRAVPEEDGEVS